jgi:hypothetical protein
MVLPGSLTALCRVGLFSQDREERTSVNRDIKGLAAVNFWFAEEKHTPASLPNDSSCN